MPQKLPEPYAHIFELSKPFQDKLGGEGHAETVVHFALELMEKIPAKPEIAIPAAILHDIGWALMSEAERDTVFSKSVLEDRAVWDRVKRKHEIVGARLARKLLAKAGYPAGLSSKIAEIIEGHDTRNGVLSAEDGVVRDADKLWRFSRTGFLADVRRFRCAKAYGIMRLERELDRADYFRFEESRRLARKLLGALKRMKVPAWPS